MERMEDIRRLSSRLRSTPLSSRRRARRFERAGVESDAEERASWVFNRTKPWESRSSHTHTNSLISRGER